jgi:putative membrane protein
MVNGWMDAPFDEKTALRDALARERTALANERTLLAYVRTALAILIVGVTAWALGEAPWRIGGAVLSVIAFAVLIVGLVRFLRTRARLSPPH